MKPEEWITRDRAVGLKFGRLTVLEVMAPAAPSKHPVAGCFCDCGTVCFKRLNNVVQGLTRSCGCMQRECLRKRKLTPRRQRRELRVSLQPQMSMKHVNAALDAMVRSSK